jgi:hypothetical protein
VVRRAGGTAPSPGSLPLFRSQLALESGAAALGALRSLTLTACGLTASRVLALPLLRSLVYCDLSDNNLCGLGIADAAGVPQEPPSEADGEGGAPMPALIPAPGAPDALDALCWLAFAPRIKTLILRGCELEAIPALFALNAGAAASPPPADARASRRRGGAAAPPVPPSGPALEVLDLSCNRIALLDGLEPVAKCLRELDLSVNEIGPSLAPLRPLAAARALAVLSLEPNPVTLATPPSA